LKIILNFVKIKTMTHIDIYNSLEEIQNKLDDWYDENCVGSKDSVNTLFACIVNNCRDVIYDTMRVLENDELICQACLHLNLSASRKTIFRYMAIENEIEDFSLLKEAKEKIDEICLSMKKTEDKNQSCERIRNTAYRILNNFN